MNLQRLIEKRGELFNKAEIFLDTHTAADGKISAADAAAYEQMEAEIDLLGKQIDRFKRREAMSNYLSQPASRPILNHPQSIERFIGAGKPGVTGDEYRRNFLTAFRTGFKQAQNVLRTDDPIKGGYLLPQTFEEQLVVRLADENVFRLIGKVITTKSEHQINLVANEPSAHWIAEGAEIPLDDVQFGRVNLQAFKLACATKISNELLSDSFYDVEAAMIEIFARSLARAEEQVFISGNGTTEPQGILPSLEATARGCITTQSAEISADDVINLHYSLRRPYRKGACFVASDAAISHLRRLKDSTGGFLWQNSLTAEEPPTLLGAPIYTSPFMPAVASGNVPLLFGDFRNYFVIADRGNRTVKRLDELFALTDTTAFLMLQRVDSRLIDPEAVRGLKIK